MKWNARVKSLKMQMNTPQSSNGHSKHTVISTTR